MQIIANMEDGAEYLTELTFCIEIKEAEESVEEETEEPSEEPEEPSEEDDLEAAATLVITKQPESVTVPSGSKAYVSFDVEGDGLTYQWYFAAKDSSSFKRTSTFTSNFYSITMSSSIDGRQVYCVVTDEHGNSVTTDTVTVNMIKELKFGDFTYEIAEDGIVIVAYTGSAADVVVPETIDGQPVVKIGDSAFEGNATLKSIDLPDTITVIGKAAFKNCTSLTTMN